LCVTVPDTATTFSDPPPHPELLRMHTVPSNAKGRGREMFMWIRMAELSRGEWKSAVRL
jgi:hypothetical protein